MRSIFFVNRECCYDGRMTFDIRAGTNSDGRLNDLCFRILGTSGAYSCANALIATKFGLYRDNNNFLDFKEVMAWS